MVSLSDEQQGIISSILDMKNIAVNACAGSGKTTLSIEAARHFYKKYNLPSCILTYNANLKEETRTRITNDPYITVHSYHSMAMDYFYTSKQRMQDYHLVNLLHDKTRPTKPINFGLFIIDEMQDCTELYYHFICYILHHNECKNHVLLMVGDVFQKINRYKGATDKYLLNPTLYFYPHYTVRPFEPHCRLSISWRITPKMADFINQHVNPHLFFQHYGHCFTEHHKQQLLEIWGDGIHASPYKDMNDDDVCISESNDDFIRHFNQVRKTCAPKQMAVIAYSMARKSPAAYMCNKHTNIPWYRNSNSARESEIKIQDIQYQYLLTTIHSFKGCERDYIFLYALNEFTEASTFRKPNYHPSHHIDHFNLMYVACTRARQKIFICNVPNSQYKKYCVFRPIPTTPITKPKVIVKEVNTSVTQLTDHVYYNPFTDDMNFYKLTKISLPFTDIYNASMQSYITNVTDRLEYRSVLPIANLLGVMAEHYSKIIMNIPAVKQQIYEQDKAFKPILNEYNSWPIILNHMTFEQLWKYTLVHDMLEHGFYNNWYQLPCPSRVFMEQCAWNIKKILDYIQSEYPNSVYDFQCRVSYQDMFIYIGGKMDYILDIGDNQVIIIELKITNQIQLQHCIQLQTYKSMYQLSHPKKKVKHTFLLLGNLADLYEMTLLPEYTDQQWITYLRNNKLNN